MPLSRHAGRLSFDPLFAALRPFVKAQSLRALFEGQGRGLQLSQTIWPMQRNQDRIQTIA